MGRNSPYVNGRCPTCLHPEKQVQVAVKTYALLRWIVSWVANDLDLPDPFRRGRQPHIKDQMLEDIYKKMRFFYLFGRPMKTRPTKRSKPRRR